jgi:hypothetical protein
MSTITLSTKRTYSTTLVKIVLLVLLVTLAVLSASPARVDASNQTNGEWRQYKDEGGIIGYEHNVEKSKYLETRAETVIEAPVEVLLEVLKDISSYPQWMYKCKEAVLLRQENKLKRVLYFAQDAVFGSPDRDAVIQAISVEDLDSGAYITTLHSIDNHPYQNPNKENDKKRTRIVEFRGKWHLQMLDRNRTRVVYTSYTNPGGFAPRFIANGVIRKVSFESLKGMISKAKEHKYIEAAEKGETKKKIEAAIRKGSLLFAKPS